MGQLLPIPLFPSRVWARYNKLGDLAMKLRICLDKTMLQEKYIENLFHLHISPSSPLLNNHTDIFNGAATGGGFRLDYFCFIF